MALPAESLNGFDPETCPRLGFLYAFPDGTRDRLGNRFWNASDACCDLFQSGVDDVAYLTAVIDDMSARFHVDAKRIHLVGHSNGGFMSHRYACDRAERVAAFVSLAGDNYKDAASLSRFLDEVITPWIDSRRAQLLHRPLIREHTFGQTLNVRQLERLGRYEVHLDRKLERMLAMLFRLKELRTRSQTVDGSP